MKKVEAIIKPFKLGRGEGSAHEVGIKGITVTEAKGLARAKGPHRALSRGGYVVDSCPRSNRGGDGGFDGRAAVEAIQQAAPTGGSATARFS